MPSGSRTVATAIAPADTCRGSDGNTIGQGCTTATILNPLCALAAAGRYVVVVVRAYGHEANRQNHEQGGQAKARRRALEKIEKEYQRDHRRHFAAGPIGEHARFADANRILGRTIASALLVAYEGCWIDWGGSSARTRPGGKPYRNYRVGHSAAAPGSAETICATEQMLVRIRACRTPGVAGQGDGYERSVAGRRSRLASGARQPRRWHGSGVR